ncbi:MAG TPA: BtpA/SgcQ family protein [Candidatus Krumholzibacteria bacterium]|nr:BtpA/SgcQ family protein [Candidatus Krumholzibacteria bacterium]
MTRDEYRSWMDPPVWGVIHLPALPGAPDYLDDPDRPLRRALEDASHLARVGFTGVVVENFGDAPFHATAVEPVVVAAMARVVAAVRERHPEMRVAVNCLRNDALSALAIATACQADAIRVNVHVGAAVTDQGLIEGRAAEVLRARRSWGGSGVRILADVAVKHAAPLAARSLADEAADARTRGRADALLLTGRATGAEADPGDVVELRDAVGDTPLLVASGVTADSAPAWIERVDGAIVGSDLMHGGRAGAGVDPDRARRFLAAWTRAASLRTPSHGSSHR